MKCPKCGVGGYYVGLMLRDSEGCCENPICGNYSPPKGVKAREELWEDSYLSKVNLGDLVERDLIRSVEANTTPFEYNRAENLDDWWPTMLDGIARKVRDTRVSSGTVLHMYFHPPYGAVHDVERFKQKLKHTIEAQDGVDRVDVHVHSNGVFQADAHVHVPKKPNPVEYPPFDKPETESVYCSIGDALQGAMSGKYSRVKPAGSVDWYCEWNGQLVGPGGGRVNIDWEFVSPNWIGEILKEGE